MKDFVRLCEIESPSLHERAMADAVTADLRAAGLEVHEDSTGAETGSDAGNLLARIPGPEGAAVILLCAHLDTVPLDAPVEVQRDDSGVLSNRHEAILGADNKAAVAVLLAVARRFAASAVPVGVELLFTTAEERALAGAKAFDLGLLEAEMGFVLDHATPLGELLVAAPTYYRLVADFHGHAAHAGIRPEDGRNAIAAAAAALAEMPLGRLDPGTTANVGVVHGGTAGNVVAERCRLELETRSLDHERAAEVARDMVDRLTDAAGHAECDVETVVEEGFRGYRLPAASPPVQAASAALEALGLTPSLLASGGGSDANVLQASMPCLNVANGTERNHEPGEQVSVAALELSLDVALGIVHQAARSR